MTTQLVLLVLAVLFLVPLAYIVFSSFKSPGEALQVPQTFLPRHWSLANYATVFNGGQFGAYFWNSIVITVGGVLITAVVASLAGYGFAKLPFRGQGVLLTLILATLTIPLVVFLVPMFLMEDGTGLLNTQIGLILPNVALHLPFTILIMRAAFLAIPKEVEESATLDGAGAFRAWWAVMLPMARNGVVLCLIVTTYETWGEYTLAKTLAIDPPAMPLTVGLTLLKGEVWDFGTLSAVIVLAILPPIIVFAFFQRHIVAGLAQGAIKG
ncbi:MAG TPA: carbohydrate ABC transporter permease [Thermomicrobiales bacterium]|nr:carbohydrate ABC transporter permease [Thermomicrobiales bacterium]